MGVPSVLAPPRTKSSSNTPLHHISTKRDFSMSKPILIIATDIKYHNVVPWEQEGYSVTHISGASQRSFEDATDDIEPHTKYAIIAFGDAATHALSLAASSIHSLAAVIAYYPTALPPGLEIHPSIDVVLHLPMSTNFSPGSSPPHVVVRTYPDVQPGFAETSTKSYDRLAAGLAYSRTLDLLRRTIGPRIDLEDIWTEHMLYEFVEKDVDKTMATMIDEPYVNHVPTCTGGIGYKNLYNFYKNHFIPQNPPSLKMKLVSRTVGADRIVDEMVATFRHDCKIDWMLPGVEPTGKRVEVALVSIVCVRGGKLYHEHIYWDQATVLVQIGLLDPEKFPVLGAESARKVLDKGSVRSNRLIPGWKDNK